MSQPETAQVAAAVTADILGVFVEKQGDENAARILNEMSGDQPDEAPQAPPVVSSPTPAADAAPEPAPEAEAAPAPEPVLPDLAPVIPEDLQALLDEPDIDAEVAAEVAAEQETYDENYDPDTARELKTLAKRNAWLEQQVVQANRGKWIAENARAYPLLETYAADELRAITATSRRAFAREAQALHDRYAKALKPALDDLAKAKSLAQVDAEKAARAKAAEQWGLPAVEPSGSESTTTQEAALTEARKNRASLEDRIKIMFRGR